MKTIKKALMWFAFRAVLALGFVGLGLIYATFSLSDTVLAENPAPEVVDLTPEKIKALKQDLLATLSQCENPSQNNGLIIYDNNSAGTLKGQNIPSIGLLMFKIQTVKASYDQFYGIKLSDAEAVIVAMDKVQAFALAENIIFSGKDTKGIDHWHNCSVKHSLSTQVNMIKKFEKI